MGETIKVYAVKEAPAEFGWTTKQEMSYLDKIGESHMRAALPISDARRLQLLHGYRQGLQNRTDWDRQDEILIRVYVDAAIARLI